MFDKALFVSLSYVVGSIPFGLLIAKAFYGLDIREHGSGNPGATNVWRVLGKKPGAATLTLDILKGVAPILVAKKVFPAMESWAIYGGVAAIIGHNWSVFLKFKGGKGVATSAGVFLALIPRPAGIAILGFILVFLFTRHVSLGSMAGALLLLLSSFYFETSVFLRVIIVLAALMLFVKHIPNMKRLREGTEPRVKF